MCAGYGCGLAVSRVTYPYIIKGFPDINEGVTGVGNRGKNDREKPSRLSGSVFFPAEKPTTKSRFSRSFFCQFFQPKTDSF